MGILGWVVLGAMAGFVAHSLAGGRKGQVRMVVVGVLGGVVGGFAASEVFHRGSVNGLNVESVLIAITGAVVVLLAWRLVAPRHGGYLRL